MSLLFILLLALSTTVSFADTVTDSVTKLFTDARVAVNKKLSSVMEESCASSVARLHVKECRTGEHKSDQLEALTGQLKKIDLSLKEDAFIAKLHQSQKAAMVCEIQQLRGFYNEESVKPFYGTVLGDLCSKLPELKFRWEKVQRLQKEVESVRSSYAARNRATNYNFMPTAEENNRLLKIIEQRSKELSIHSNVFTQLRTSIWRSGDPSMESLIFEAMSSTAKAKDVCDAARPGFDPAKQIKLREKFQEAVILPMIQRAQSDLYSIGDDPKKIGVAGVNVLLQRSDWEAPSMGNHVEASMMMCDLEQKYTRGDDRTQRFLTVGSFALGGAGAFLKVAKFATFLKPEAIRALLATSRVLLIASAFPATPLLVEQVADACSTQNRAYSMATPMCPLNEFGLIDMKRVQEIETIALEKDNCALNLTLAGVSLAPSTVLFLKQFKAAKALTMDYRPIKVPAVVKISDLYKADARISKQLDEMNVKYSPIVRDPKIEARGMTTLEANVVKFPKQRLDLEGGIKPYYGQLLKVDELPPPGKDLGAKTIALQHPEMAAYKKRIEDMGYNLVIDTSISTTGAEAYIFDFTKVLALSPKSSWQTFVHEFQHVEFNRFLRDKAWGFQLEVNKKKRLTDVMRLRTQKRLGADRVKKLEKLLKKQVPKGAIDEALSVDAELRVLGLRRFVPGVGSRSQKYALRYQISLLEKHTARTPIQDETLRKGKETYKWLERYEQVPTVAATAPLVGVSGFAAEKYLQVFYDDDLMLAQKSDGNWDYFTPGK
jgi:hypothetical protein